MFQTGSLLPPQRSDPETSGTGVYRTQYLHCQTDRGLDAGSDEVPPALPRMLPLH